jgi:hypothetical protein
MARVQQQPLAGILLVARKLPVAVLELLAAAAGAGIVAADRSKASP